MNAKEELVPELHDVMKLTDKLHGKSLPPEFSAYEPENRTWDGVMNHHTGKDDKGCPFDRETFLLSFVDKQASNFNRHIEQKYKFLESQYYKIKKINKETTRYYVNKIWNPIEDSQYLTDVILKLDEQIIDLLMYLQNNPSFDQFIEKYKERLIIIPEDKHWWLNVTSLLSHMTVTGKIYRILRNSKNNIINEREIENITNRYDLTQKQKRIEVNKLIYENKAINWKVNLAKITLEFHQKPFRARDLKIFDLVGQIVTKVISQYPDNVLMYFDNQIIMLYDDDQIIQEIVEMAKGLLVKRESCQKSFKDIGSIIDFKRLDGHIIPFPHYPIDLPTTIELPLCTICQMAKADYIWPDDQIGPEKSAKEPKDELCENCFNLRAEESRLKKLASWSGDTAIMKEDGEVETIQVAWVRHHLNFDTLLEALKTLHWDYLKPLRDIAAAVKQEIGEKELESTTFKIEGLTKEDLEITADQAAVRFSLLQEFAYDYDLFIKRFNELIEDYIGVDNYEPVNAWLSCLRLANRKQLVGILKCYRLALDEYMPALRNMKKSPFFLGVAVCNAKFPFFQVWRQFESPSREIEISLIGHGSLVTDNRNLNFLLASMENGLDKTALYNLAETAKISEALAKIKFKEKDHLGRENPTYHKISKLVSEPIGLDFRSLLTLAHLMED